MKNEHKNWLNEYLESCKGLNKSPHTIKNYESDLKKFISWYECTQRGKLYKANADTITIYQKFLENGGVITKKASFFEVFWKNLIYILSFKKKKKNHGVLKAFTMNQRPIGVNSRKRHLSSLKNFFEYMRQTRLDKTKRFNNNPVRTKVHAIKLKDQDIEHTKLLRFDDWLKLKESAWRTKEKLILTLLYHGGLRISELTNLKFENFNEHRKVLSFVRKGGSVHQLELERFDEIYHHVKFYANEQGRQLQGPIFLNSQGLPVTSRTLYRQVMELLKKAKTQQGLGPHSFRKACATNMYKRTKDLIKVRNYLNHTDAKVTQTYIEL